jgi:hypothetical protein
MLNVSHLPGLPVHGHRSWELGERPLNKLSDFTTYVDSATGNQRSRFDTLMIITLTSDLYYRPQHVTGKTMTEVWKATRDPQTIVK